MQKRKKILMVYTGGTIGMTISEKGYIPCRESFHYQLSRIPELSSGDMPEWDILDMEPLLDSSNITVTEWNKIAEIIFKRFDLYDGFVILHGTDTMSYTASALSSCLKT